MLLDPHEPNDQADPCIIPSLCNDVDLRLLARRQIYMLLLLLLTVAPIPRAILLSILHVSEASVFSKALRITESILMIIMVIRIHSAMRSSRIQTAIACGLILVPALNVFFVLYIHASVRNTFKKAGIPVGILRARMDDVVRCTDPRLCSGCGYNLTGNASGRCPECGRRI